MGHPRFEKFSIISMHAMHEDGCTLKKTQPSLNWYITHVLIFS